MQIRRAGTQDIEGVGKLLVQVNMVHHNGRPDLFNGPAQKYDSKQLQEIFADDNRPVFVAVDEQDHVMGYAFCILQRHCQDAILTDIQTLYIDDLCVDENIRGQHIGQQLYQYPKSRVISTQNVIRDPRPVCRGKDRRAVLSP